MKHIAILMVVAVITLLSVATVSSAASLEDVTVMALGPVDGRAVVKTSDGKMQVLKLGDTVPGTQAVVTQVLTDKLVVEEAQERGGQTSKQTIWILKPKKAGEKSQVQRLDREGPPPTPLLKPAVTGEKK